YEAEIFRARARARVAAHEAQLRALALYRCDQRASAAPQSDDRGPDHVGMVRASDGLIASAFIRDNTNALRLLNLQACLVDDVLVHRHFARDACAKNLRPLGDDGSPRFRELLAPIGPVAARGEFLCPALDDR